MAMPAESFAENVATAPTGKQRRRAPKKTLVLKGSIRMPDILLAWERDLLLAALPVKSEESSDGQG